MKIQRLTLLSFVLIGAITPEITGQIISCPVLTCDTSEPLQLDQCYQHDNQQPVSTIRTYKCENYGENTTVAGTPLCEFSIPGGKHAWYDEATQHLDKSIFPWESAVYNKKTRAECRVAKSLLSKLNNGRSCTMHSQCYSMNCQGKICTGLAQGEQCHVHADCQNGQYCKRDNTWPYVSKCQKANTNYEQCTETYECATSAYCWYVSSDDRKNNVKKCLPLYSQEVGTGMGWYSVNDLTNLTFEDFEINGRYCKSGLAFPISNITGNCTATDRIVYQGVNLTDPYPCNPTNQSRRCELFYNASAPNDAIPLPQKSFQVRCSCALNGNDGYCSKILGTQQYKDSVAKLKSVLEASSCHTLDRQNLRAQRDGCGIGKSDTLDNAITAMFSVNYHAYVQDSDVNQCIQDIFDDSLSNQQKLRAAPLLGLSALIVSLISLFVISY